MDTRDRPLILLAMALLFSCHGEEATVADNPPTIPEPTTEPPAPMLCAVPDEITGASLCIDEAQSKNDSTLQASPGVFPDWIEVRNAGPEALARAAIGVQVGDSKVVYLEGPDLQAGEVAILFADALATDPTFIPKGISDEGERIRLFVGDQLSDELDVPALGRDTVYGHYPSGDAISCVASPGETNWSVTPCADIRDWVFEPDRIHDFELTISPEAWATLETSEVFEHPKVLGALYFDAGVFPEVELNIKGGYGSFRNNLASQKVAFKVDLNQHEDHYWRGQKKLTFNNMVQDPTFAHESLTYALYRVMGLPAPRVSFARLHLNGEYMGFYGFIETVDEPFLELWYGNSDGHLFESAYGPDFDPGKATSFDYDNGPSHDDGLLAIEAVISTLSLPRDESSYAQLRTQVDMDQWMTNMAIEAAIWHWDGYWYENNYRMYEDPSTGLWQIIPHGTDQTWVDGWPNAYDGNTQAVLYSFCMDVASCKDMYKTKLLEVADAIEALPLASMLDELILTTQPEFDLDPRKEESTLRDSQLDQTRTRIQTVPQVLRDAAASQ